MSGIVFTVGNVLRGDDAAGPMLAERLEADPAPGWTVIDGGQTPENHTHAVRAAKPERVLLVDAAEMGLEPGEMRLIDEAAVVEHFLITTHAIPLSFLIQSLRESVPEILFLGIQPQGTGFYEPVSPAVEKAVATLHGLLRDGSAIEDFPRV
ncbi:hydrogenase maturation peptidase HycI [Consotaella aegiceratis]|uniref:hydrogenase maturation peptidase HycI n=1 Tax=Consotaella aegiceratis TaxID=3097961 RepID=UPI002F41566C